MLIFIHENIFVSEFFSDEYNEKLKMKKAKASIRELSTSISTHLKSQKHIPISVKKTKNHGLLPCAASTLPQADMFH